MKDPMAKNSGKEVDENIVKVAPIAMNGIDVPCSTLTILGGARMQHAFYQKMHLMTDRVPGRD
jgi:hypothetical protein